MSRKVSFAIVGVLGLGLVTGGGLALLQNGDAATPKAADLVVGQGSDRLPFETASDWVSYADHVAVVEVMGEKEAATAKEFLDRGEGLIGRDVDLSVQKILWSRPNAEALPASITFSAAGWVLHDHVRKPFVMANSPRVEVGHTYIVPVASFSEGWGPIATSAILPYEESVIGKGELKGKVKGAAAEVSALTTAVDGEPASELADALAAAQPDPLAQKYAELSPDERWQRVATESPDGN